MSLHFLLDGYNIIKQTPNLNHGTLENQRKSLLDWISISQPQGSRQNSVTVIFDGQEEFFGSQSIHGIRVVFSQGQSADDVIKKMVEDSKDKKNWVVVSNDRDIKLYVRALGAKVLAVNEFTLTASRNLKTRIKGKSQEASSGKYISLTQQAKITQELERLWIKQPKSKI